jgi:hypothetical protein
MKKVINAFVLGTLGVIFTFDTITYLLGNDTISEQITAWINDGNELIFGGIVLVLITHFVFGKYKE